MGLLRRTAPAEAESRFSIDDIYEVFTKGTNAFMPSYTWAADGKERVGPGYQAYVARGYESNGVVFSVILARLLLFAEATFKFRHFNQGRPGDLFGTSALDLLETPWPNATTGDLLARMEQDASLAGNCYIRRHPDRLERLRPDWVEIVTVGAGSDPFGRPGATELFGYTYHPYGDMSTDGIFLTPDEVAHYAPIPDPLALYRGMSWLTPVVREVDGDSAMTRHKNKFFDHAATPNMMVKFEQRLNDDAFERLRDQLERRYSGVDNAYRTMILEGGADATVVGTDFRQMTFTDVQAAGENRIAAAAGVPGIVVGLKEGLQAATYSNYAQAMRRFVDLTMRPLWRNAARSLSTLVQVPAGTQLWYDDRDIPALRQDAADLAEIQSKQAVAIRQLIDGGYTSESVVAAVENNDLTLLKHSGFLSVQLWKPGENGVGGESAKAGGGESNKNPDGADPKPADVSPPTEKKHDEVIAALSSVREATDAMTEAQIAPHLRYLADAIVALAERDAEPPVVNVEAPQITVEQPDITVQAPAVTVEPQITVEQPDITVQAPAVTVEAPPARTRTLKRDRKGNVTHVVEED